MKKEISEDELIQNILTNATNYSSLLSRFDKFSRQRHPWFMKMRELQRAVTFDDIRASCDKAVYKTFAHDVFKQIVHEYIVNTRTGRGKHWFHLPSNSLAGKNSKNVRITPTYAEFVTPGQPFHFTFPDVITYEWQGNNVVPKNISKVRFAMTGDKDISDTLGKLNIIREQLEATNKLSGFVREFIFGTDVDIVEDLTSVNLTIIVPQDCPLNHDSLSRIPVTHGQVEQTVAQMFNQRLGKSETGSRTPKLIYLIFRIL